MANSLRPVESATLQADESRLIESLRIARSSTTKPERNRYTKALMASINADRPTCVRQLLALLRDAFERGASESELLGVGDELNASVIRWFEEQRSGAELSLADAHLAEETAEAAKDIAETVFVHSPSLGTAQQVIRTAKRYEVADSLFVKVCRNFMHRATA